MTQRVFTKADDGGTFDVAVDEQVTLALTENPTTGYRWQLDADAGVVVVSSDYAPAGAGVGGGGTRRFVVYASAKGTFALRARLLRAWVGEGSVIERFQLTIRAS